MRVPIALTLTCVVFGGASSLEGQQPDRPQLIAAARAESDYAAALDIYLAAAEPTGIDSLWTVSVFEIAQILRDLDDVPASDTWIRWAVRLGPEWPIDPDWFTPTLVAAHAVALESVGSSSADSEPPQVSWSWPDQYAMGSDGAIVVTATDPTIDLAVTVDGGAVFVGNPAALSATVGTHAVVAAAPGHEPRRFDLEALPGVSATLTLEMIPLLSTEVAQRAGASVLRLSYRTDDETVCTNAVSVRDGLLVGALDVLRSASDVALLVDDQIFEDVEVVEQDEETGLAFVQVENGPILPSLTNASARGFGWAMHRAGCETAALTTRMRVQNAGDFLDASAEVDLPLTAAGAPIIDASGAMLGLVVGDGRIASAGRVEGLTQVVAGRLGRGGFPLKWVGAGVAAAAGALVYFLRGDESSTGSIIIDIPSS